MNQFVQSADQRHQTKALKHVDCPHSKAGARGFRLTLLLFPYKLHTAIGKKSDERSCVENGKKRGLVVSWLCFTNCNFWKSSYLIVSSYYSVSEVCFMHLIQLQQTASWCPERSDWCCSFKKDYQTVSRSHIAPLLFYENWLPYLLNDSVIFFLSLS